MTNPFDVRVVDAAARKTKFVRRQPRAITPVMVLRVLVRTASLRAVSLALVGALLGGVSAVAVFRRLGPACVAWLGEVFAQLASATDASASLAGFPGRVLVQDSTVLGVPKSCRKKYRGAANQRGSQPQARLQCVVDLVRGALVWARFDSFRRNDQKSARMDLLAFARCGDLLLRDRGYFTLVAMAKAMAAGIHLLTRLRFGTLLFDARTGRPFDLRHHLRQGCSLDRWVRVGEARLRLRLVCLPLSAAHANDRRRKARADRDARLNHNRAYFHQLGWAIFLTSVPPASLGRPSLSARDRHALPLALAHRNRLQGRQVALVGARAATTGESPFSGDPAVGAPAGVVAAVARPARLRHRRSREFAAPRRALRGPARATPAAATTPPRRVRAFHHPTATPTPELSRRLRPALRPTHTIRLTPMRGRGTRFAQRPAPASRLKPLLPTKPKRGSGNEPSSDSA